MNKVYVGNLSWNATQQDLEQHFAQAGTVTEAKIVMDRDTGRSRGFAFVTFATPDEATRAVTEFDASDFQGRTIKVNIAENKPRDARGGGNDRRVPRRTEGFKNSPRDREY